MTVGLCGPCSPDGPGAGPGNVPDGVVFLGHEPSSPLSYCAGAMTGIYQERCELGNRLLQSPALPPLLLLSTLVL